MSQLAPIVAYDHTDVGRVHDHNEDYLSRWEPKTPAEQEKHGWLYVVADGVGGAEAGEIASQYATEQMKTYYLTHGDGQPWGERLRQAMLAANTMLRQLVAYEHDGRRMATTMVAAVLTPQHAYIANVGDSRAYHWRAGSTVQITRDQSLVARLVEEGAISAAEAENHPYQNVILYSIGSDKNPRIDLYDLPLMAGDVLLLCSDGLTKHVSNAEIGSYIGRYKLADVPRLLVDLANERGGRDNISVIAVRYGQRPQWQETPVIRPLATTATLVKQDGRFLWRYTLILALIQSLLTVLIWFLLRP